MASDEAKIRVRLDTREAKGSLQGLVRDARMTAGRVGRNLRGTVGRGLGLVGLGGVIGASLSAIRSPTETGVNDVLSEAFSRVGFQISDWLFGDLNQDARASSYARSATIEAYKHVAGAMKDTPPGAVEYYNQLKSLRLIEETGAKALKEDPRFYGPGISNIIDKVLERLSKVLDGARETFLRSLLIAIGRQSR